MLGVKDLAGVGVHHHGRVARLAPEQAGIGNLRRGGPNEAGRGRDEDQCKESHKRAADFNHARRPSKFQRPPGQAPP